jgi:hypothetical protein
MNKIKINGGERESKKREEIERVEDDDKKREGYIENLLQKT